MNLYFYAIQSMLKLNNCEEVCGMEWDFSKTSIVGYGRLLDPKGKAYNVEFDDEGKIEITTTKQNRPAKVPQKVLKMIQDKLIES